MTSSEERRQRILNVLGRTPDGTQTSWLCKASAEVTSMTGAGIMLMSGDIPRGWVCTTDDVSAMIEQLQFTLGEGPCVDAYHDGRPVMEPNLEDPTSHRWPAFTGPALEAGARAVFGFPVQVGAVRLGALNLYSDRPGSLTDDQFADAVMMANVAAQAVLVMQANAPPGSLAMELERGTGLPSVVHQATGMVAAQLNVSVGQALIRLRAYAFGNERLLVDVAREVVVRSLRFDS